MSVGMRVSNNRVNVEKALRENIKDALNAVGLEVSGAAKDKAPVKDGVLRASIAYAFAGSSPQYTPDTRHKSNNATPEGSQGVNNGVIGPKNGVIVGTNVVYAKYQHEGVSVRENPLQYRRPGAESKFLEKAARENRDRIEFLLMKGLRGELPRQ